MAGDLCIIRRVKTPTNCGQIGKILDTLLVQTKQNVDDPKIMYFSVFGPQAVPTNFFRLLTVSLFWAFLPRPTTTFNVHPQNWRNCVQCKFLRNNNTSNVVTQKTIASLHWMKKHITKKTCLHWTLFAIRPATLLSKHDQSRPPSSIGYSNSVD